MDLTPYYMCGNSVLLYSDIYNACTLGCGVMLFGKI